MNNKEENNQEGKKKGRPTKYSPEYIDKVDEYLDLHQDEDLQVVRQSNSEKGYEMYDNRIKVKLPTVEGFARFINVPKSTLYDWREKHQDFSDSLEKIVIEQQERLINSGLSGAYNPTIAKLMLSSNHGMVERKDHTSDGEQLPAPIVSLNEIRGDNSTTQDSEAE